MLESRSGKVLNFPKWIASCLVCHVDFPVTEKEWSCARLNRGKYICRKCLPAKEELNNRAFCLFCEKEIQIPNWYKFKYADIHPNLDGIDKDDYIGQPHYLKRRSRLVVSSFCNGCDPNSRIIKVKNMFFHFEEWGRLIIPFEWLM